MSTRIVTSAVLACVAFGAPSTLSPAKIARIDTTADALLATVQVPPGVPVATVGIDNAKNAAHLAIRILKG